MLDDMVMMGLYPLFSHKHKELRFAILLPFSALSDAENGRLSANFICHAPAPFYHAPGTSPASGHQHVGAYILSSQKGSSIASMSLCTFMGGPKMASFSNPPAGLWPAPSRCSYISQLMFPKLSVPFFFFFGQQRPPLQISTLPYFPPATFYPVTP